MLSRNWWKAKYLARQLHHHSEDQKNKKQKRINSRAITVRLLYPLGKTSAEYPPHFHVGECEGGGWSEKERHHNWYHHLIFPIRTNQRLTTSTKYKTIILCLQDKKAVRNGVEIDLLCLFNSEFTGEGRLSASTRVPHREGNSEFTGERRLSASTRVPHREGNSEFTGERRLSASTRVPHREGNFYEFLGTKKVTVVP